MVEHATKLHYKDIPYLSGLAAALDTSCIGACTSFPCDITNVHIVHSMLNCEGLQWN